VKEWMNMEIPLGDRRALVEDSGGKGGAGKASVHESEWEEEKKGAHDNEAGMNW